MYRYNGLSGEAIVRSIEGSDRKSLIVSAESCKSFERIIEERVRGYTSEEVNDKLKMLRLHLQKGVILSDYLTISEYQNILFVPSFRNRQTKPRPHAAFHMTPILNKRFDCAPNIYVAYPEDHTSLYKDLMLGFDVNVIPASGMYTMGAEDYTVTPPEGVKFDAVYLVGIDMNEGTSFNSWDIKADFAHLCTENFDLIDHYIYERVKRGTTPSARPNRLIGETKDVSSIIDVVMTNQRLNMNEYASQRFKVY